MSGDVRTYTQLCNAKRSLESVLAEAEASYAAAQEQKIEAEQARDSAVAAFMAASERVMTLRQAVASTKIAIAYAREDQPEASA